MQKVIVPLLIIAGLIGGWALFTYNQAPREPVVLAEPAQGNPSANITVVEYGDLQCPACAAYAPFVKRLSEEHGEEVRIEYRHFPLSHIHPHAVIAARAVEAAGVQGKFFEMHDVLFERQQEWSRLAAPRSRFVAYAEELGIDATQFRRDLTAEEVKNKVEADQEEGLAAGVNSTPSFFVNGQAVQHPSTYEEWRDLVLSFAPSETVSETTGGNEAATTSASTIPEV